ncbi:hypothetical protein ACYCSU_16745 [Paenibacillus sp. ALE1]
MVKGFFHSNKIKIRKSGRMRYYPINDYDFNELKNLKAEPWMIEMLKKNPSYLSWGNFEDYMSKKGDGWDSRVTVDSVDEGLWELDSYNELVNFYFEITRDSKECECCEQTGYNEETKQIADDWYDFKNTGRRWCDNITNDEVEALWKTGRLKIDFREKPSAEQVNAWSKRGIGHDGINRVICIEQRARRFGVYGKCPHCDGRGYIYTEDRARLALQLWILHPRKGCSRGVYIKDVKKNEIDRVIEHLKLAKNRNNERFSQL